jgi:hypothetical protein
MMMMEKKMRVTREYIRSRVAYLQNLGYDVAVDYLNGMARITNKAESKDISPRLRNSEMVEWIGGYIAGLEAKQDQVTIKLQPLRERLEAWRDNADLMRRHGQCGEYERWHNEWNNYRNLIEILDKL